MAIYSVISYGELSACWPHILLHSELELVLFLLNRGICGEQSGYNGSSTARLPAKSEEMLLTTFSLSLRYKFAVPAIVWSTEDLVVGTENCVMRDVRVRCRIVCSQWE